MGKIIKYHNMCTLRKSFGSCHQYISEKINGQSEVSGVYLANEIFDNKKPPREIKISVEWAEEANAVEEIAISVRTTLN